MILYTLNKYCYTPVLHSLVDYIKEKLQVEGALTFMKCHCEIYHVLLIFMLICYNRKTVNFGAEKVEN